ncbi:Uncharacterised protein [Vibrio cholerae]|nr:Uncharacterised protein [Vibrio cholerae]CSB66955.1 Uncharacterised protein [Vibrio cholerae]CSC52767.1 Uncharacterised protein [Vibrio cholerae]CSC59142.1 Uncharacterised protein [Vibrio cholerae]CSC64982.1 Uncharacterised protein [Vibrio cholerae]
MLPRGFLLDLLRLHINQHTVLTIIPRRYADTHQIAHLGICAIRTDYPITLNFSARLQGNTASLCTHIQLRQLFGTH